MPAGRAGFGGGGGCKGCLGTCFGAFGFGDSGRAFFAGGRTARQGCTTFALWMHSMWYILDCYHKKYTDALIVPPRRFVIHLIAIRYQCFM